ncbi:hypothetical protein G7Z17_g7075 [Cylindrodendrum hubeiense]|uniref:Uncharacterized protein n=1 Tax=Cylindrodendrum hubeiense TaxID=595255 RepID=A0A9P5H9R7_9HYPO|nr:hypothetical protein G7Z17_g7075 [Cylindrodendrum hubeiense]
MTSTETPSDANGSQQETFKEQLDRAAAESRSNLSNEKSNPIVEKITEYVPAAAKIFGSEQSGPNEPNKPEVPGPPERPDHDEKIEGFVRDQHRSKGKDGLQV